MANNNNSVSINIGEKIKALRKKNELSIQKLAKKAGVSPAGIYKIETNEMTPTITTLMKIAGALDKKVSFFINEEESLADVEYIQEKERKKVHIFESKAVYENLAAKLEDCLMEAYEAVIEVGGSSGDELMAHRGEELDICLSGTVEFTVRKTAYVLSPGDSIHFKARIPHSWRNVGNEQVKMISVVTPPPFS